MPLKTTHTFLICFLLACGCYTAVAQKIEGYVYDKATEEPIPGVMVYFDGSSVGTVTTDDGHFDLETASKMNSSLVISYMGYSTVHIADPYQNKLFKIYLEETTIGLAEVVLRPDPFTREEKMEVFRKQFLGANYKGQCSILNEDDITVTYNMNTSTLLAFSDVPLRIKNNYLGYEITYSLVTFETYYTQNSIKELYLKGVFFAGTSFFKDISAGKGKYKRNREKAYYGSSMHFLRTVAKQNWEEEKFTLFKGSFPADPKTSFTITDTIGYKKLTATQPKWNMLYRKEKQSAMELKEPVYIDIYGNFTPLTGMVFSGYMGMQRFRESLPLDYDPEKN